MPKRCAGAGLAKLTYGVLVGVGQLCRRIHIVGVRHAGSNGRAEGKEQGQRQHAVPRPWVGEEDEEGQAAANQ